MHVRTQVQHEEEKKAWAGRQNSTVACDGDLRDERLALEASLAQHRAEKAAFQQALAEHESLRTALETKQREFSGLQAAFEAEKVQTDYSFVEAASCYDLWLRPSLIALVW